MLCTALNSCPVSLRPIAGAILGAALLLMMPGAAGAAGTVSGGPERVKGGYDVSVHAVDAKRDTLTITIDRGNSANGQTDSLQISKGVEVTVKPKRASIKGTLGRRGAVKLELREARKVAAKPPKGCTGDPGRTRAGRLEGRLRLRLPNGKFVTLRSLRQASSQSGGRIECGGNDLPGGDGEGGDGNGDGDDEPRLMLTKQTGAGVLSFVAVKRQLSLYSIGAEQKSGAAKLSQTTTVRASGKKLLRVTDGGARANVSSAGAFTGTGLFRATANYGSFASGPLSGSLRVKPQGGPVVHIAGEEALLLNGSRG